jgi:hypothetical protein
LALTVLGAGHREWILGKEASVVLQRHGFFEHLLLYPTCWRQAVRSIDNPHARQAPTNTHQFAVHRVGSGNEASPTQCAGDSMIV